MIADCTASTILSNGTKVRTDADWCLTILPGGIEVHAHPGAESAEMAERLGYGDDVSAMTREHDALHATLTDFLGMPHSFSLMQAAGEDVDATIAALEEAAVLAVQELRQRWHVSRRTA